MEICWAGSSDLVSFLLLLTMLLAIYQVCQGHFSELLESTLPSLKIVQMIVCFVQNDIIESQMLLVVSEIAKSHHW